MGNLEGVLEALHARGVLAASFWNWLDIPGLTKAPVIDSWYPGDVFMWWWRASRVLADKNFLGQDMIVQPINEFPFFSFLLGDNHPHVLALPFVLLAIALAFNLLLYQVHAGQAQGSRLTCQSPSPGQVVEPPPMPWITTGPVQFSAIILGAWDFKYLGPAHLLVWSSWRARWVPTGRRPPRPVWIFRRAVVLGLGLGILSGLLYIFFYLSFSSQAAGILPYVFPPTRLPQYLVMFGTFVFLVACFLLIYLRKQSGEGAGVYKSALNWWWRILLICIGLYLMIMLMVALVLLLQQLVPGSTLISSIQANLGGLDLGGAFSASASSRLRDPWLLLLVSALLAMVVANLGGLLSRKALPGGGFTNASPFSSDVFALLLIFTGFALSLVVEFIYLAASAYEHRVQVYYQAWVCWAVPCVWCLDATVWRDRLACCSAMPW
jgi:uncharacterized membrane protein